MALPASAAIETVVTTARKREESLQDVPVAAFALGEVQLQTYAIVNLVDVAKMTPGLIIERSVNGSATNMFLRGVGSSSINVAFDQAVSVNVDNVSITKGRAIFDSQLDMEQVEVLKGPQALFFGKNSTGGVITVKTADPGADPEYIFRAGFDMISVTPYGEAIISTPISDKFGARLALRGSKMFHGYFTNIAEELTGIPTDRHSPKMSNLSGRLTLKYDPTDAFDYTLKVSGTDEHTNGVNAYSQITNCQGPGGTPQPVLFKPVPLHDGCKIDKIQAIANLDPAIGAKIPWYKPSYSHYWSTLVSGTGNYHFSDMTLTSVTGYYRFSADHVANFDAGTSGQIFGGEFVDYDSFTQELRLSSDFDGPLNFSAGVFYDSTKIHMSRPTRLFDSLPIIPGVFEIPHTPDTRSGREDDWDQIGQTKGNTISAFGQLTWDITDQLELSGGARWSHEKKQSTIYNAYVNDTFFLLQMPENQPIDTTFKDSNVSPEATLSWRPSDDLMFYVAYKQGYKSGGSNLGEVPQVSTKAENVVYGAEQARGGEIGAKMQFLDNSLRLNLTGYRYLYKDLQVTIFNPVTVSLVVSNAGRFYTTGLEGELLWDVPSVDGLVLRASANYNRARYKDYVATCYTGQTPAAGCNLNPSNPALPGGTPTNPFNSQDLAGHQRSHAPEWMVTFGYSYDFPIANGKLMLGLNMDGRYMSGYFWQETLPPLQKTNSYVNLNASIRLYAADDSWELAIIGTNITDKFVGVNSADLTGTGSGTGTAGGVLSDVYTVLSRPREIAIQGTFRF